MAYTQVLAAPPCDELAAQPGQRFCVLHLLRGGLDFGLREALHDAHGFQRHGAAFTNSQRDYAGGAWHVREDAYRKPPVPAEAVILIGDVAATGATLRSDEVASSRRHRYPDGALTTPLAPPARHPADPTLIHPDDLSDRCAVLVAEDDLWWSVLRRALGIAGFRGGQEFVPQRVNPRDFDLLGSDEMLDLLEFGILVVVDLTDIDPQVFPLVSWLAKARPDSVLLLRHGHAPLPHELHEFAVRTYGRETPRRASESRVAIAEMAARGGRFRVRTEIDGAALTTPTGNRALRRKRMRNGVTPALRQAARRMLDEDVDGALDAMRTALQIEPHAPDLLLRTALLHRRESRWAEALTALERALEAAPFYAPAWRELGIVRQRQGLPGAEEALRRAVDGAEDFEALVALALMLGRRGEAHEAVPLMERGLRFAGGQLSLALPTLIQRAARDGAVRVDPWERERVEQVLQIRQAQATASPPEDAPWSFFDAARAHLLLGAPEAARTMVQDAAPHLSAPWQAATFGQSLDALELGGLDVDDLRACLDLAPRTEEPKSPEPAEARPPFRAEARPADWFVENVPCMSACPVGTDAGAYVHLLAQSRFEEAYHVARGPNPFASVCGRICAAPCEDACRRGHIDAPVEIRSLKRFLTQRHGVEGIEPRADEVLEGLPAPCIEGDAYVSHMAKLRGDGGPRRKVAVVGGGPAGLACAHDLAILGHEVVLYEASHQLGGMMRQGIPIYRLSRDLLELEIGAILSMGVDVQLGVGLDAERNLASLLEDGADAVFLASGAGRGRHLQVEGAHLDGVVRAIDFLLNANQGFRMEIGQQVAVVGGGNVALDVARTARLGHVPSLVSQAEVKDAARETFGPALDGRDLRAVMRGPAREVHVIARQPMGSWPAQRTVRGSEELDHAQEEGIVFHPLRGVRRFTGTKGRVTGVELAEVVQLQDASGRYRPMYGSHQAEFIPCDTVFLAVGQEPDLDYLAGTASVVHTSHGLIEVDRETLATSMPGVYAGGDAAFGPRTLIEAVADGKRAARNIHAYFTRGQRLDYTYTFHHVHPRGVPTSPDYDVTGREGPPLTAVGRRTGIAEVEGCYDEADAVRQAGRCLVCHVQTIYDGDLCIACGRCTDVCPQTCLSFVDPSEVDLGEDAPEPPPIANGGRPTVWMVKDEDRCIRCGLCAERCPTGAMTMQRLETTAQEGAAP